MVIKKADIEAVAVKKEQYPLPDFPEIAFAGRSNVGKSSLLNLLTNKKKLARTSSSPGKTRTINFYNINDEFRIVELPGYGYANASKTEMATWGKMMDYLENRDNLLKVVQLVDIRHAPSAQDIQMYEYLRYYNLSGLVVATKADKVSANEKQKCLATIRKTLKLGEDDLLMTVSALKRVGYQDLLDEIERIIIEREEHGR